MAIMNTTNDYRDCHNPKIVSQPIAHGMPVDIRNSEFQTLALHFEYEFYLPIIGVCAVVNGYWRANQQLKQPFVYRYGIELFVHANKLISFFK
jgi:hypothetical protein